MPLLHQSRRLALMLLSTALSRFLPKSVLPWQFWPCAADWAANPRQLLEMAGRRILLDLGEGPTPASARICGASDGRCDLPVPRASRPCRGHRPLAAARAVRRFSPPSTPCRCGALRNCWTCLFRSGAAGMPWALADSVVSGAVLPVPVLGRGADMALRPSALGCRRLTARRSGPSCRAPCPTCAKALDRNGPLPKSGAKSRRAGARRRPVFPAPHQSKSSLPSWFRRVSSITNVSAPARITTSLPTWLAAPRTSPQLSKRA